MSDVARLFNVEMDAVRCPFPIYDQLRETAPIQFVEAIGCFVVTGYNEAVTVLQDSQTFASQDVTGASALMRRLLSENEAHVRLAGFDPSEMAQKLRPLLLILDKPEHAHYRTLLEGEEMVSLFRVLNEFESYFTRLLADRIHAPQNDVLSDVARAQGEGHLTHQQAISFLLELLVAGNETTTNHLLNTMALILLHPGTWERLRADRSLVKKIVEESLRLEAPIQGSYRTATTAVTIGGVSIPVGARVYVSYVAANRDPHQFDHPNALEVERSNVTRHITFGRGPHTCLGAPLARTEARLAFEVLLDRFAGVVFASPDEALDYLHSYINRGPHRLRMVFTSSTSH